MKTPKTIKDKIAYRIASSKGEVFMRKDFNDIADYDQVGCSSDNRFLREIGDRRFTNY